MLIHIGSAPTFLTLAYAACPPRGLATQGLRPQAWRRAQFFGHEALAARIDLKADPVAVASSERPALTGKEIHGRTFVGAGR